MIKILIPLVCIFMVCCKSRQPAAVQNEDTKKSAQQLPALPAVSPSHFQIVAEVIYVFPAKEESGYISSDLKILEITARGSSLTGVPSRGDTVNVIFDKNAIAKNGELKKGKIIQADIAERMQLNAQAPSYFCNMFLLK